MPPVGRRSASDLKEPRTARFVCTTFVCSRNTTGGSDERTHLPRRTGCGHHGHPFLLWVALRTWEWAVTQIVEDTTIAVGDVTDGPLPTPGGPLSYIHWGPVIAGAVVAAAVASVLHAFAAAIGLAVSSTSPTWRDASFALWALSGLYLIFVALVSYGCGAYLAGRVRSTWATSSEEIEFRDGAHGILVWALATLLTVALAFGASAAATRLAAPGAETAGPSSSVGGENLIAYDLDRLFRG